MGLGIIKPRLAASYPCPPATWHEVEGQCCRARKTWPPRDNCGTSSEKVAGVEAERIAKALRQKDDKIDPAELDAVIAILSGQQPKNELEAMMICQMAVTHALTSVLWAT
jgi:hypothetical protein